MERKKEEASAGARRQFVQGPGPKGIPIKKITVKSNLIFFWHFSLLVFLSSSSSLWFTKKVTRVMVAYPFSHL